MGLWTDKDSAWREGQYAHGAEVRKEKGDRNEKLNAMVEQMRGDNSFRVANLNAEVQRENLAAKKPLIEAQTSSINTETGLNKAMGDLQLKEAPEMIKLNKEGLRLDAATKRGALMGNMEKFFKDSGVKSDSMAGFMNELYGEDYLKYSQEKEKATKLQAAPITEVAKPALEALKPAPTETKKKSSYLREASRYGLPGLGAVGGAVAGGGWNFGAGSVPGAVLGAGAMTAVDQLLWNEGGTPTQRAVGVATGGLEGGLLLPGAGAASKLATKTPGVVERLSKKLIDWK